jgi:hypothetical protein
MIAILYIVGFVLTWAVFIKLGQDWARADIGEELTRYDRAEVRVFAFLIALVWPIVAVTVLVHVAKKMLGNNLP